MPVIDETGATTFTTPSDRGFAMTRVFDARGSASSRHLVRKRDDGTEMGMTGGYREIVDPERLVTTERWGGEWPETLSTVMLREVGGKTEVTLTILHPSREARDAGTETGMKEGAGATFDRLEEYLRKMD